MGAVKSFLIDQAEELRLLLRASPEVSFRYESDIAIAVVCPDQPTARELFDAVKDAGYTAHMYRTHPAGSYYIYIDYKLIGASTFH